MKFMVRLAWKLFGALGLALATSANAQGPIKVQPFDLGMARLLPGPLLNANKACVDYLLKVEPDRLLHNFRENAGLKPKADKYGGWESQGLAGHTLGHYLTACSQEYAVTRNKDLKAKVDAIVADLAECQANRSDGYISAIPDGDAAWTQIRSGVIHASEFGLNGMWSPWYTNHKVLAGLIDAYRFTGNKQALVVASKFADWMVDVTRRFDYGLWQDMLVCEYGGMNEALADLSVYTKKTKYLDLAQKFYDRAILDPLIDGKDSVASRHSNTQIPKVSGLARIYELTSNVRYLKATKFFWYTIVKHHSYANGGNSLNEYLGQSDKLSDRLSNQTCEACNTYNMLKLTRHMFEWDPRADYFDYYERALYNHTLAAQDPETAGTAYFTPLNSGGFREYSTPFDTFTCCHGSGLESMTKLSQDIYFHQGPTRLYVNLYVPSELYWRGQTVRMETAMPTDGKVNLTIAKGPAFEYELALRHPIWAKSAVQVRVNGNVVATSNKPSSTILIRRVWKAGDKVTFTLPMSLTSVPMNDNPNRVAFAYGPNLLAADLGDPKQPKPSAPCLITNGAKPESLLVKDPSTITFRSESSARPYNIILKPFSDQKHNRYATYFDCLTNSEWQARLAAEATEAERLRDLQSRTIDSFVLGNKASEDAHSVAGVHLDQGDFDERHYTLLQPDGVLGFQLKAEPNALMQVVITYFGNERIKPDFSITMVGRTLAAERLAGKPLNQFYDVAYTIPQDLTEGAQSLRFEIIASPTQPGPCIAAIRLVRIRG